VAATSRRRQRDTEDWCGAAFSKGQKKDPAQLGDVNYIDSSGIGDWSALSPRRNQARTQAAQPDKKVHDLLQITKLTPSSM